MLFFTIYDHPKDYPDHFVARGWLIEDGEAKPTNALLFAESLENLRKQLPVGLFCLTRHENDDPNIIETWI
jgi:hypothetical protein